MRKLLSNQLFTWLLCITLLFKVIVPVGFMPDFDNLQRGLVQIKVCTGFGPQNVWVDQKQSNPPSSDSGHKTEKSGGVDCPFAGMHASSLAVAELILALLLVWQQIRYGINYKTYAAIALTAAWPRGPPSHLA